MSKETLFFIAHTESELESSKPSIAPMAELPVDTLGKYYILFVVLPLQILLIQKMYY